MWGCRDTESLALGWGPGLQLQPASCMQTRESLEALPATEGLLPTTSHASGSFYHLLAGLREPPRLLRRGSTCVLKQEVQKGTQYSHSDQWLPVPSDLSPPHLSCPDLSRPLTSVPP